MKKRSKTQAFCIAGVWSYSKGYWNLVSEGTEVQRPSPSPPSSLKVLESGVSLWSNEARISFCLSVQLPSFRVFLTPPSSLPLLQTNLFLSASESL